MTYQEALAFFQSSAWKGSQPGLERIEELLEALGHPEAAAAVVHVAGTNGKGSTVRMLERILTAAGYRTGAFISPFLTCVREQFLANGEWIGEAEFAHVAQEVAAVCRGMSELHQEFKLPTEFELYTAAAFCYFRLSHRDIAVIECGMGGRLDATNVVHKPLISVITKIGMDHMNYLGNTPAKIAAEKAGIIHAGRPVISVVQEPEVTEVIRQVCEQKKSPLFFAEPERIHPVSHSLAGQVFDYTGETVSYSGLTLPLLGAHQLENVACALRAVEVLKQNGFSLSDTAVRLGLAGANWPARMEVLSVRPLVVLDGGHNPQGIEAAVRILKDYFPKKCPVVVTGVMKDKDYRKMYWQLLPFAKEWIAVEPENTRALPAKELAGVLAELLRGNMDTGDTPVSAAGSVEEGVRLAMEHAGADGMVLAIGSLYMAGAVRKTLNK